MFTEGLSLLLLISAGGELPPRAGSIWVETPAEVPVIDRGPAGAWDHLAVDNPFVLVEDGTYYCFFEGQDKPFAEGGHEQVGLATSTDGVHWQKSPRNPILGVGRPGAWDSLVAKLPSVIRHGEKLYLFYSGRDGRSKAIGLATSVDFVHWRKNPANPILRGRPERWDKFLSTHPAPVFSQAGRHYLLYRGMTRLYANQGLGLAVSDDLVHWQRVAQRPVIPPQQEVASLAVVRCGDRFVGISQAPRRTYWSSRDLVDWQQGPPALFSAAGVDTLSNPYRVGRRWNVVYEKHDRIHRAVLREPNSQR